jgi:hypothetical protein
MQPSITPDGSRFWYTEHRQLHRADGPAIEHADGSRSWWLYDRGMTFDRWLEQTTGLTDEEKVMMKLKYG